jgi:hypothetical protein
MGVADLRAAFNNVAEPVFSCQRATLSYKNEHDRQFQILSFSGTDAAGKPFSINSEMLRPGTDVNLAAAAVAQSLLDRKEPAP